jgi:hypothetical protein
MEIMNPTAQDYSPTTVHEIAGIDEEIPAFQVGLKPDYGSLAGQCYVSSDTDRARIVGVSSIVHSRK